MTDCAALHHNCNIGIALPEKVVLDKGRAVRGGAFEEELLTYESVAEGLFFSVAIFRSRAPVASTDSICGNNTLSTDRSPTSATLIDQPCHSTSRQIILLINFTA